MQSAKEPVVPLQQQKYGVSRQRTSPSYPVNANKVAATAFTPAATSHLYAATSLLEVHILHLQVNLSAATG